MMTINNNNISYLFKYSSIWLQRVLVSACGLFTASHGIFCGGTQTPSSCGTWASVVVGHRLSSCGAHSFLLRGTWDVSSPTRDQIRVPGTAKRILNHWITSEVLHGSLNRYIFINAIAMTSQNCWHFMS